MSLRMICPNMSETSLDTQLEIILIYTNRFWLYACVDQVLPTLWDPNVPTRTAQPEINYCVKQQCVCEREIEQDTESDGNKDVLLVFSVALVHYQTEHTNLTKDGKQWGKSGTRAQSLFSFCFVLF